MSAALRARDHPLARTDATQTEGRGCGGKEIQRVVRKEPLEPTGGGEHNGPAFVRKKKPGRLELKRMRGKEKARRGSRKTALAEYLD